jgi:NAD kinase
MSIESKIVLVKRNTRLDELISRFNTLGQAKFYIEHLGADFNDYKTEHDNYYSALNQAKIILSDHAKLHVLDRKYLPNYIFGSSDIVVALGQDGLVANTLKYLNTQLLVGVNPDTKRYDGVLLPFQISDLNVLSKDLFSNKIKYKEVTMAKVVLNDGQTMLAVNDFFIGQKTHTSARYTISYNNKNEYQSSSGIIISTGLGTSGWFKSVLEGSLGIINSLSGSKKSIAKKNKKTDWSSNTLYFSVREPFPSNITQTSIVFGQICQDLTLKLISQMPENGVIFSDGIESDYLNFNSGIEAEIKIADHKGKLVY